MFTNAKETKQKLKLEFEIQVSQTSIENLFYLRAKFHEFNSHREQGFGISLEE